MDERDCTSVLDFRQKDEESTVLVLVNSFDAAPEVIGRVEMDHPLPVLLLVLTGQNGF